MFESASAFKQQHSNITIHTLARSFIGHGLPIKISELNYSVVQFWSNRLHTHKFKKRTNKEGGGEERETIDERALPTNMSDYTLPF